MACTARFTSDIAGFTQGEVPSLIPACIIRRSVGAGHGCVSLVAISCVDAFARKYTIAVSALVIR